MRAQFAGSSRMSAASTARSAQFSRGLGLTRRSRAPRGARRATRRSSTPRTGRTATASRQPARRSGRADATAQRTIIMIARSPRSPRSPMRRLLEPHRPHAQPLLPGAPLNFPIGWREGAAGEQNPGLAGYWQPAFCRLSSDAASTIATGGHRTTVAIRGV
jgi:hypothetical protein